MKSSNKIITALIITASLSTSASAFPGYQWEKTARSVGIDPLILYSVALAESATDRGLNMTSPWPYAIRNGSSSIYAKTKSEAEKVLQKALQQGDEYKLDVGLMQINLHWHGKRVQSPKELLDPLTNLSVGSSILADAISSSPDDLELGIGRYHSWNEERARWYGQRVLSIYRNLLNELEVRQ